MNFAPWMPNTFPLVYTDNEPQVSHFV